MSKNLVEHNVGYLHKTAALSVPPRGRTRSHARWLLDLISTAEAPISYKRKSDGAFHPSNELMGPSRTVSLPLPPLGKTVNQSARSGGTQKLDSFRNVVLIPELFHGFSCYFNVL